VVKRIPWLAFIVGFILVFFLNNPRTSAQEGDPGDPNAPYYYETGHYVKGDFLERYRSVSNQEEIFGYPLTEAFFSTTNGHLVQYFQKARFELYPENPPELRIVITPLGELLYIKGKPLPVPDNFPTCRTFPETDYKVCFAFLEYFLSHGGIPVFGYPISNFETQNGLIVQYFQRARMEWHPELPPGKRVVLAELGVEYFDLFEDPRLLPPLPGPWDVQDPNNNSFIPKPVLYLQVQAYPEKAVLPTSGHQTLYILVRDQKNNPVADATATIIITYPSKRISQDIIPTPSDGNGIIRFPFDYKGELTGITTIEVTITYDSLPDAKTITSFRIWW
jgi:hypothetical protein